MSGAQTITIRNELAELAQLAAAAAAFWEGHAVPPGAAYAASLALEEMVSNVIRHGYRDRAAHEIRIGLAVQPDALTITVEDDGCAFDPLGVPEPDVGRSLAERPVGGLGIHLVRKLCREMRYRRIDGHNHLEIVIDGRAMAG